MADAGLIRQTPCAPKEAASRIKQEGIIAIIRGNFPVPFVAEVGRILVKASISVVEVAFNSERALQLIASLQSAIGGAALVGAGTIRSPEDVDEAFAAGARFIVAPTFDQNTLCQAHRRKLFYLPGVLTPTEVETARAAGCHMVKLFPSGMLGPQYLRTMRGPFDKMEFVPTGGVNARNIREYVTAGAVAVGVGSALIQGPDQALGDIARRARELKSAWEGELVQ